MNKAHTTTTTPSRNNHIFGWKFWVWLASAFSLTLFVVAIISDWAVRHVITAGGPRFTESQSKIVRSLSEFPGLVRTAILDIQSLLENKPIAFLKDRKSTEQPYWIRRFPAQEDSGFLLFSGIDPVAKQNTVQLIRISDGTLIAKWFPDWQKIFDKI